MDNWLLEILKKSGAEFSSITNEPDVVFWGVAPTGIIHIGYLPYIAILRYFKKKGKKVIIFIGDYHGYLDSEKTKFEEINGKSTQYHQTFKRLGFDSNEIVLASNIYAEPRYIAELFKISKFLKFEDLLNFAGDTLKSHSTKDFFLSDGLYVATQIIDLAYLGVDLVLSGIDESGIYKLGIPIISEKFARRIENIYMSMVRGVISSEMHATNGAANKIMIFESESEIKNKLIESRLLVEQINSYIFPLFCLPPASDIDGTIDQMIKIWNDEI